MPTPRRLPRNIHSHEHGAGAQPFWLLLLPAYSILPLVRWPLGYEIVKPVPAFMTAAMVAFLPYPAWFLYAGVTGREPPPAWGGQGYLLALMALSFIVAAVTFAKRWRGQMKGEEIHTAEAGYSGLTSLTTMPVPLSEIIVTPLLIGGAGWLLYSPATFDVSVWLMACGLSYFRMAFWEHSRKWAQVRAVTDDMTRAQVFEERLNAHEAKAQGYGQTNHNKTAQAGKADMPDVAELGGKRRQPPPQSAPEPAAGPYPPAPPPDIAAWSGQNGGIVPDSMAWFRKKP